jgi:hypothetical protein
MDRRSVKTALPRGAAADLWRNTLSQIPSTFGRLVYLASLRDANTGRYEHHGLALVFGDAEADKALRASHEESFGIWLGYTLQQQHADLDLYLAGLESDKRVILETWTRLSPYRSLLPESVRGMERQLYLADLEALLAVLRNEYGVASPDPDA